MKWLQRIWKMSRFFFERMTQGQQGVKQSVSGKCMLKFCDSPRSKYKGPGSRLCEFHQGRIREYGGPGRTDRPWTFNKKDYCEICGMNPWEHPLVKQIQNPLVKDRTAQSLLIVDHIHTQRDGGCDSDENTQTLCQTCNEVKTVLAGDRVPQALYSEEQKYREVHDLLDPIYDTVFGKEE